MKDVYEIKVTAYTISILINGVPHVSIKKDELIGIQSWIEHETLYFIEFTLRSGLIETEYDSKEKWLSVLKLLGSKDLHKRTL